MSYPLTHHHDRQMNTSQCRQSQVQFRLIRSGMPRPPNQYYPNRIIMDEDCPYYHLNLPSRTNRISQISSSRRLIVGSPDVDLMLEYVSSFRNMQEVLRRQEGEIYGLQSRVIELERQLNAYRRPEGQAMQGLNG